MSSQALLRRLTVMSYQRYFRVAALLYPSLILVLMLWIPPELRLYYLLVRLPLVTFLAWLGWTRRELPLSLLRLCTLLAVAAGMLGNIQLVRHGGPNLVTIVAHAAFLLVGFMEVEVSWTLILVGLIALLWHWSSRRLGGSGDFAPVGLTLTMAMAAVVTQSRRLSLGRMANLLAEQQDVNAQVASALAVVEDCNALLHHRVEIRRQELEMAQTRLQQAYTDLQASQRERSRLQAEFLEGRRLETLARFASGLSHSFSNSVTSIWCGLNQLDGEDLSESARQALRDIELACDRSASICARLRLACGTQTLVDQSFDLNERVRENLPILQRAIAHPLLFRDAGQPCQTFGDPSLVDQILLNLVVNASAASSSGQSVEVEVHSADNHWVMRVCDSGQGIEEELRSRIFEPFFTTKGPGQGHGLGLAIVQGAVERLRGSCRVESEAGKGSVFEVTIPKAERLEESTMPEKSTQARVGSLRVLLVEDQDALRTLLRNYLSKEGHQVMAFSCAEEWDGSEADWDLLLTDISLPGRNGVSLAEELSCHNPKLRVVFMSGHPFEVDTVSLDSARWTFLPKPFRLSELAHQLKALLDG